MNKQRVNLNGAFYGHIKGTVGCWLRLMLNNFRFHEIKLTYFTLAFAAVVIVVGGT